jgi:hypothetical protein
LGPLVRRHNKIDVASSCAIKRMVGHASSIDTHLTELITPRYGRSLILERAHRLPAVEAGVIDRYRLLAVTQLQARQSHTLSLRASASAGHRKDEASDLSEASLHSCEVNVTDIRRMRDETWRRQSGLRLPTGAGSADRWPAAGRRGGR